MSFPAYFLILALAGILTGAVACSLSKAMAARDGIVGGALHVAVATAAFGAFAAIIFQAPEILGLVGAIVAAPVFVYFAERGGSAERGVS